MNKNSGAQHTRGEVLPALVCTIAGACLIYVAMTAALPLFANNAVLPGFLDFLGACIAGSPLAQIYWLFADFTETTFLASLPATIGLVVGVFIAAHLERTHSPHAGTGVDGNSGIFTRMFLSAVAAVVLGIVIFGHTWPGFVGWIPTFAALLVVQPLIIHFGASPAKLATCVLLGTIITFPIAHLLITYVVTPLGVPLFVGVSAAVTIVVPILAAICRALPWMAPEAKPAPENGEGADISFTPSPFAFFINRVLGDIGELTVYGSSIGTALMYAGVIVAWTLNPLEPAYGAGNLPLLIASQIICGALSVFIYYPNWKSKPFEFTFGGIVFTSAIVGGICVTGTYVDFIVAGLTIVIGAVAFVPIINSVLKAFKFDGRFPAIALIQLGIFPVVTVWALLLNHIIIPML